MKVKLPFILLLGTFFIGCSIDPIEEELSDYQNENRVSQATVTSYGCAGPDNSKTITLSEAKAIPNIDKVKKLYLSLLAPGVSQDGEFSPSIAYIINAFDSEGSGGRVGDYPTTYTLSNDECSDSVELTLSIVPDFIDPSECTLDAGQDGSRTMTLTEALAIPNADKVKELFLNMLEPDVPLNGEFAPSIYDIIEAFDAEGSGGLVGEYTTSYTIIDEDCSDSVTLTLIIIPDFTDPSECDLDAGFDSMKIITLNEALAIPNADKVKQLFLDMLEADVPRTGEFDPTIYDIIRAFDAEGSGGVTGDYITVYTINDGDCSDSVEFTLRVVPNFTDPVACELDAGEDKIKIMTLSEAVAVPNYDKVKMLYLEMLDPDVQKDGDFDPSIWNIIRAFDAEGSGGILGDYTTIYTITDGECTDSVQLTIRIVED